MIRILTLKMVGLKKPHYHLIYVAKNPVTAESVRLKIKRALGNQSISHVEIVRTSMENTYLYLTHESKDAIEKKKNMCMIKRISSI